MRPADRHDPTRCGALEHRIDSAAVDDSGHRREAPATRLEVSLAIVQYQVRTARITDVDRIVSMLDAVARRPEGDRASLGSADLLRQLVNLPHAVVLVAESGRRLAGAGVLALHPGVSLGGFVGTVDVLIVDPASPPLAVRQVLLAELLKSGRNKGCVAVETAPPNDPAERDRWTENGFVEAGPRMVRSLAPFGAPPE